MAFQQSVQLNNGATGGYIRISVAHLDYMTRQAAFTFSLYTNRDYRLSNDREPLMDVYAMLRLNGSKFDQYFLSSNMSGANHITQAYKAAKVEMPIYGTTGQVFGSAVPIYESDQS